MNSTNGSKMLPGTRMHQGGPGSLYATPEMASRAFWRPAKLIDGLGWTKSAGSLNTQCERRDGKWSSMCRPQDASSGAQAYQEPVVLVE